MADSPPHVADTYFAVLTPTGRGAIATIGVRGPRAIEIVGRRWSANSGRPLAGFPAGRIVLGRFRNENSEEELVVGLVGPDEVEVNCHGGRAAVEAVAAALVAEGATRIDTDEWVRRTEPDTMAAEALLALTQARTERTAAILLDQYRGALRSAVALIEQHLSEGELKSAAQELERLLAEADQGRHLTRPWLVVLAGRPNVGKSSLMNALLGYQRSIVFAQPGTTRDVLTASAAFDGWPVELADTAGLRTTGDPLEAAGAEHARQQAATADLVLLVCDTTTAWTSEDRELLAGLPRPFVVHNKCDLAQPPADGRPVGIAVSALTGDGLAQLAGEIARRLVPDPPPTAAAVPLTDRQVRLLRESLATVQRGDSAAALRVLSQLIGGQQAEEASRGD